MFHLSLFLSLSLSLSVRSGVRSFGVVRSEAELDELAFELFEQEEVNVCVCIT